MTARRAHSTNSYHTHMAASGLPAMLDAAAAAGISVLGISEHVFQLREGRALIPEASLEGPLMDLVDYAAQVAYGATPGVALRLGLEVDFLPDRQAMLAGLCARRPWDYLIGSVHAVGGCLLQRLQAADLAEGWRLWRRYAALLEDAVRTGGSDILGHPLRLARFLPPPPYLEQCLQPALAAAAHSGVAFELNGADVAARPDLQAALLGWCRGAGVAVTFGADAHSPDQIDRGGIQAVALLRQAGFVTLTGFRQRQAVTEPLPRSV